MSKEVKTSKQRSIQSIQIEFIRNFFDKVILLQPKKYIFELQKFTSNKWRKKKIVNVPRGSGNQNSKLLV